MTKNANQAHPVLGWLAILLGLFPLGVAFGLIETDPSSVHAPMWVLAMCGLVFVVAGSMMLLQQHKRLINILAALVCLSFASVGVWASLFSASEGFSGGVPFVSNQTNVAIARWVFGGGAVISFLCFVYAVRLALRRK